METTQTHQCNCLFVMTGGFDPFAVHNAESARTVRADAVKTEKIRALAEGNA